jgi:hypothetical protein
MTAFDIAKAAAHFTIPGATDALGVIFDYFEIVFQAIAIIHHIC